MKSGISKVNFQGKGNEYKSFYPTNLKDLKFDKLNPETINLLTKANSLIEKINGLMSFNKESHAISNKFIKKEAVYSLKIEGIISSF